ncbi:helix-turn-helix domain-containing protein [Pseudomonas sp. 3A(2025)]
MNTLFPVANLAAKERYEYWQDVVCATYGPVTNKRLSDQRFDGALEVRTVGNMSYSRIQSIPIEYNRQHAGEGCDQFFLTVTLCEETFVSQAGRDSRQELGDMVLYDGAQPYINSFPNGDHQIALVIPRPLLLSHMPKANDFLSRTLSTQSPLGRLANSMIMEMWRAPALPATASQRLNNSLLDVMATAFETAFARQESAVKPHQVSQLQRIKEYLLDNLHDPQLTIDAIAQATFVSSRTLNRLFASEGTTAIRWLWMQRLSACHQALLSGRFDQVTEAALSFGFTNLSHFSHAFKRAYGVTAQQLLRAR